MHHGHVKHLSWFVVWGCIALCLVLALETANYLVVVPTIVIEESWNNNITSKCPGAKMEEAYSNKSEIQNGMIGIGFGAYFGMIFFAKRN